MSPSVIGLIAVCESVGVGLIGAVVLRQLRRYPTGVSLVAVIVITVCAMNTSAVTTAFVTRSAQLPVAVDLAVNWVAGVVSLGVGLLLGRSVMTGGRRLADATRFLGAEQRFRLPDDPPTGELAELARELRITSDKLAESRRREQAAEASRRRTIAWISHDLRSPLARLRALTESIEDGVVDDLPYYCRKIRTDADRLTEMVDDLFELSRIQAGTLRLTPREVALNDLVSDEVAGLDTLAGSHGVRLRANRVEPVTVRVDDRVMSRVFNNLLGNAIQYSPANTTVSVDVRAADGWAMVSVSDECGGIPPEDLGSVFDMGWRGDARRSPGAERGGGLGLAIVQGIVQAHLGKVSVRNVAGGCCFEVRLPLAAM
ncbi:sensor histidine kinase [Saccharopolyspora sp. 5N708]|uniref:sensor histidine kinase n=1 Tax=Saccharopolyspora sp. 5N708 TaxID=3457424 RepID=UPI003FD2448D